MNRLSQQSPLSIVSKCFAALAALFWLAACGPIDENPNPTPADCTDATTLEGPVSSDTTISSGSCYNVESTVAVESGVTLTVEPGTVVQFQPGAGLNFEGGRLNAVGSSQSPILFTGVDETPGSWQGIRMHNSNSNTNVLEHVTIAYGGTASGWGANLFFDDDSGSTRIRIRNTTFRDGGDYGLKAEANNNTMIFDQFAGNTFSGNEQAMRIHANDAGEIAGNTTFENNAGSYVQLSGTVSDDQTWAAVGAPYRPTEEIVVDDAALTLAAGTSVTFESGTALRIDSDASLAANGTQSDRIVLRGVERTPGFWEGVTFKSSNSTNNALEYTTIRDGGGTGSNGANLFLDDDSGPTRIAIENSRFVGSSAFGIYTETNNNLHTISAFAANEITGNKRGLAVNAGDVGELDAASTYTGNDDADVEVAGTVVDNQTWPAIDASYRITDDITVDDADLTIRPGATFRAEPDVTFIIESAASLAAKGTSSKPIRFSAQDSTPGTWYGLYYDSSGSSRNALEYVTVEFGGKESSSRKGNVSLDDDSGATSISIDNCTLRKSSSYGIYVEDNNNTPAISSCSGTTFDDNADGNINVSGTPCPTGN